MKRDNSLLDDGDKDDDGDTDDGDDDNDDDNDCSRLHGLMHPVSSS